LVSTTETDSEALPAASRTAAAGFTLVELLVVIAILALMVGLLPSLLPGVQAKAEMRAATLQLAAALRETRGQAIAAGDTATFTLDTKSGRYRAGATKPRVLPRSVRSTLVTTTEDRLDDGAGTIRFFADGGSTGGGVRLAQGERRTEIRVDWLTGRIAIAELQRAP
jgi:general secretion pathway protein H